ncbi:N-methylhydantoinase B [Constrictibacter sp. MBR-5]|jgi:N-methylhydantoinase B|uniref:hydantoinase B/oxoprolinase family protein n=1 Tax=Constrictibacter sp. MBR-5 TaxID=3156467 RepID=UPI00339B198C
MTANPLARIRMQVMWNRLLAVVEEQGQTLVRTAFSTSAREAGDISAGVFDVEGRMLAQAVTGTPGHINSMALAVKHFIDRFPVATMREGDVYITNDPWKGTGHLHDLTVVTPTFRNGELVALFACTSHLVDIGGIGLAPDGRQVYQEGLFIPLMPLVEQGRMNAWFMEMVRANVREPIQVEGDIYALIACNEIGCRRLVGMMDEYGLETLDDLGAFIIDSSRRGMQAEIDKLPKGTWRASMRIDGYEAPIDLVAALTIAEGEIVIDFEGTSGVSTFGINCPLCYTEAYTTFGVRCIVGPGLPNNAGSLEPIKVRAPIGSIVNPPHPCAVVARSTIGHMLPDVVFGCLDQAIPGRVPAEGTSNLWNVKLGAGHGLADEVWNPQATAFQVTSFHSGGTGARPRQDGLSATPYPSGVRNVPVEATEAITPLVVWAKELRQDSGGPGRQRGGLGQTMVIGSREAAPFAIFASFERVNHPARGRAGGKPGTSGRLSLGSGTVLKPKGRQTVPTGERLIVEMPGGGGIGDAFAREPERVAADVRKGYVTAEAAVRDYGVAVGADMLPDEAETRRLRAARS